jgi:pimeloyl-ACP methyl ester carboxylesterase
MLGGGPHEVPERYAHASPAQRLPLSCPCVLVWGERDSPDLIDENRLFVERCEREGQQVELIELPEDDHFSVIDPRSAGWTAVVSRLEMLLRP